MGNPARARRQEIEEQASTLFARWGTVDLARETVRHFAPSAENDDAFVTWLAEYMRLGASPGADIALDRMNLEVDVRSILPAIRVPTLVVNRVGDRDAKIGEARYLAERIPGATLVELPGDDHFPSVGIRRPSSRRSNRSLRGSATARPKPWIRNRCWRRWSASRSPGGTSTRTMKMYRASSGASVVG